MKGKVENQSVIRTSLSSDKIQRRILMMRGVQVMLDRDLAELYGVPVKRLNEQMRRNSDRFPDSFMFQLSDTELVDLKSHFATSSWGGVRKPPKVFTEQGVAMLSAVLNSQTAVRVSDLDHKPEFAALAAKERKANADYKAAYAEIAAEAEKSTAELREELERQYSDKVGELLPDEEVFMAIAEDIGFDAAGKPTKVNELDEIGVAPSPKRLLPKV